MSDAELKVIPLIIREDGTVDWNAWARMFVLNGFDQQPRKMKSKEEEQ